MLLPSRTWQHLLLQRQKLSMYIFYQNVNQLYHSMYRSNSHGYGRHASA